MKKIALFLIRLYQLLISPMLGPICRFTPSCSQYAMEAIQKYGISKGARLAFSRICRCNPRCLGGHDPVP
ncbi:membrane protein insertion efficiency factor YidD [Parachlamydia sp. AcF125]|uniref:membrane protein insertion efficiency factor YidD n=1 Tax=Parachlamydia sp. AcF125 TaxID=2795736 RepID=UPI001BC96730|nr:membrane protein insertion efficiency factor YidD [Parachlamydia sp. AcF125]MBS4169134.1 putative membrane protein insertion efficiency factor [Parachlamydia sp. AcF125]